MRCAYCALQLWVDPPQIADGFITAPERPGHGLRFKEEVRRE
jgi:L-alanine-DL-glutamate epimerase-like enolase superfamily enzyme